MSDEIQDYFANKDNCFQDLNKARKTFGSTLTTEEEYDQLEKCLGLMFLYCPEDIQGIVEATLSEASWRRTYHEMRWIVEAA